MSSAGSAGSGSAFEDVAAELYGLPLEAFTARRDEVARQARAAGNRGLADQIKALRRPTVVTWLTNQLVREHPDQIRALLEVGDALREAMAQLQGPQLRHLAQQQRAALAALLAQAGAIAAASGQQVSDDAARGLGDTLHAALADPDAAVVLQRGQLTTGIQPPAFGGFLASATATAARAPAADRATQAPATHDWQGRVAQARADMAAAEASAAQAQSALREASDAAAREDDQARQAAENVSSRQGQLRLRGTPRPSRRGSRETRTSPWSRHVARFETASRS